MERTSFVESPKEPLPHRMVGPVIYGVCSLVVAAQFLATPDKAEYIRAALYTAALISLLNIRRDVKKIKEGMEKG